MKRREFLLGALAAGIAVQARAQSPSPAGRTPDPRRLARISIMTFNFNAMLRLPNQPETPARTLEILDVPEMFADRYGVHNIEMQQVHFASTEPAYLRDLRAKVEAAKSAITQINLEFGMNTFSSPDPRLRAQAVAMTNAWLDHALAVGCTRVMINQGQLTPEKRDFSFAALKEIGEASKAKGVKVSFETRAPSPTGRGRGAPPADPLPPAPAWVVNDETRAAWRQANPGPVPATAASANPPAWMLLVEHAKSAGTCVTPDVGGMGAASQDEMNAGLRATVPMNAGEVHINFRDNPQWDLPTTVRTIRDLGFNGLYTIEVAGAADPHAVTAGLMQTVLANL